MSDLFDVSDQVAVITGSTKGIGKAIAERFIEDGAKVVISSRKEDACEAVMKELNEKYSGSGGEAISIPCNVTYKEQLQNLVDKTMAKWGRIDTLVCNAAANPYYGPSIDMPDSAFEKVMDVNVKSNWWLTNMVLPQMKEMGKGQIIIISSTGGYSGSPVLGAYGISKAADFQITRNISAEWSRYGIRANCIAPGLVKTDFARALWDTPEAEARSSSGTEIGRMGEPDDIAGPAIFLASAASRWMTGQIITVSGSSKAGA